MQKILNLLKTFYIKYTNLKKEYWTHILICLTYTYYFLGIYIYIKVNQCEDAFILFMLPICFLYIIFIGIILIIAPMSLFHFNKLKIQKGFLLENKIYNIIWHIGNILFIFIAILLLYLFT